MSTPRITQLLSILPTRPEDPFVRYALGIEYVNSDDDINAKKYFAEVHAQWPQYVPNYLHFGMLLRKLGESTHADKIFSEGIVIAGQAGDQHARSELQGALNMEMP